MREHVETVVLWRCRGCGKWSHARSRPRTHLRKEPLMEAGVRMGTLGIVCGPFVRWHAQPDPVDADRPNPRGLGHVEKRWEWDDGYDYEPPAFAEVLF
jgi:hypothetical protein